MWAYMASCDTQVFTDEVAEERCCWMNSGLDREVLSAFIHSNEVKKSLIGANKNLFLADCLHFRKMLLKTLGSALDYKFLNDSEV